MDKWHCWNAPVKILVWVWLQSLPIHPHCLIIHFRKCKSNFTSIHNQLRQRISWEYHPDSKQNISKDWGVRMIVVSLLKLLSFTHQASGRTVDHFLPWIHCWQKNSGRSPILCASSGTWDVRPGKGAVTLIKSLQVFQHLLKGHCQTLKPKQLQIYVFLKWEMLKREMTAKFPQLKMDFSITELYICLHVCMDIPVYVHM